MTGFIVVTALMLGDLLRFIPVYLGWGSFDIASHAIEGLVAACNSLAVVLLCFHLLFESSGFGFQKANFGRLLTGSSTS